MPEALKPQFLRVKNWEEFQHYKDRRPPWIKLHVALTDDYAFTSMSDVRKYHLIGIWLLAARTDNKIPNDPLWVAAKIEARDAVDLFAFIEAGFLVPWKKASSGRAKWSSRYIPKEVRADVLERDQHQCRSCTATDNLEIDHIIPISRGGTSAFENLQVLCRRCNRAKRTRGKAEQVATQMPSNDGASVLPSRDRGREEAEAQAEKETDTSKAFVIDIAKKIEESLREAS